MLISGIGSIFKAEKKATRTGPVWFWRLRQRLKDGTPIVRVLPITHTPPTDADTALEIPAPVKNRLRLDEERSWIILNESNRFAWPGPDLRPLDTDSGYHGPLPPALFAEVKQRFVDIARAGRHKAGVRTE